MLSEILLSKRIFFCNFCLTNLGNEVNHENINIFYCYFNPCLATKLDSEREQAQLQAEQDRKEIEKLVRDRDLLNKNLRKAGEQTQKQLSLVRLHEQQKVNLEQEITQFRDEAAKQRKIIYQLEKERDRSEFRTYF